MKGFKHFQFQNVMSDQSMDVNVRWIAVLYMKNGIEKYWRKNAPKYKCKIN